MVSVPVSFERMFATLDGAVDQLRERRREARRRELVSICEQQARLAQRVTQIVREADDDGDWRAAGCSSSAQWLAQVSSSDYRAAERITRYEQRAAQPARARPRAGHGCAEPRPGRSCRRVRDAGQRRRTRARRARQGAQRDRAGCAYARPADGGGRPGAVRATRAQHDAGRVGGASSASAAACRSSRAPPSSRRSGASPRRSARSTSRPARSSTGSSRPRTRSSHSPPDAATPTAV